MIRLESIVKSYARPQGGRAVAVEKLDLAVAAGERVALLGTSGAGKTTCLRLVNRLEEPDRGRVLVGGRDVATLDPVRLRRGLGYVVQSGALFPHLTVAENVGLLCRLEGRGAGATRARVAELLDLVRLAADEFSGRFPHQLSGGQRQRVGVARALALDPPVLLMDEPFGALDPLTRREVRSEFDELQRRLGKTVLFVTHDVREALGLGDRVGVMHAGRLVQCAAPDELLARPADEFVAGFLAEVRGG